MGKLKELELFSKTAMTNKEIAARTVRNELAARKELKQLEERMARERHAMRKKLIERKTSEQLTLEPDEHNFANSALTSRLKIKHYRTRLHASPLTSTPPTTHSPPETTRRAPNLAPAFASSLKPKKQRLTR
jgi:hypothetical protein